jgi:hypothetical protein
MYIIASTPNPPPTNKLPRAMSKTEQTKRIAIQRRDTIFSMSIIFSSSSLLFAFI